jgi:amino acid transporter
MDQPPPDPHELKTGIGTLNPPETSITYGPFKQLLTGHLVATDAASARPGVIRGLKHVLVGKPLSSNQLIHERIPKWKALAVLASDALSSVAYATEEILKVLAAAGAVALGLSAHVSLAIVILLAIVAFSYRQTIYMYPKGGGTYIVTKDNLGDIPALIAGSSLMIDYVLTVAVSVSSGVDAITSAFPLLKAFNVGIALLAIAFITIANLRGVRESASIFALPTYLFIVSIFILLGLGAWRMAMGLPPVDVVAGTLPPVTESLSVFLVLRAFASGCSAMTGTEAISDGVPAFKEPQANNAVATLGWMAVTLGVMFIGITTLAMHFHILPNASETVLSQLTRAIVGRSWFYYLIQAATALILILAANTSFSDFPRLAYFMARDRFLPRQFVFRGDRLAFSTGILALGLIAGVITLVMKASVDALIPLYAIGVFISFTFSQVSMAYRWWSRREEHWRKGLVINGIGAVTTAVVAAVIMSTKFLFGAWSICLLLPLMVLVLQGIARHYASVTRQLHMKARDLADVPLRSDHVVVPISSLNKASARALRYALAISDNVTALHVVEDQEEARLFTDSWNQHFMRSVSLVVVESPYRSLISPIVAFIETIQARKPDSRTPVTVLLAGIVPRHWWENILHNQDALRLKAALMFMRNVVVTDVPYHLD